MVYAGCTQFCYWVLQWVVSSPDVSDEYRDGQSGPRVSLCTTVRQAMTIDRVLMKFKLTTITESKGILASVYSWLRLLLLSAWICISQHLHILSQFRLSGLVLRLTF
jgi:hypothetical protein